MDILHSKICKKIKLPRNRIFTYKMFTNKLLFVSIELALIHFRHYTRMISLILAMVYLQILLLEYRPRIKMSKVRIHYFAI